MKIVLFSFYFFLLTYVRSDVDPSKNLTTKGKEQPIKAYGYNSLKEELTLAVEEDIPEKEKSKQEVIEKRVSAENEYTNCMNLINQQYKDKTDSESLKLREELEQMCAIKHSEDKKEEERRQAKIKEEEEKDRKKKEKLDPFEEKNKQIKSQLGISNDIDISNKILSETLSELKNCSRNYRDPCPLNWKLDEDLITCVSPDSYIGPCEKRMSSEIDISEKKNIEKKCLVFWKCDIDCIQDFEGSECPMEWTQLDEENCQAPSNYTGKCSSRMKFVNLSPKNKSIYSNICDVRWPCMKQCEHDYSVLCPEGWIPREDGTCVATSSYKGSCDKVLYLKNLDRSMKEIQEEKCNFHYPCVHNCEKNYDDLCPNSWMPVSENECAPSENYHGSCKQNYIFKNKNIEEKQQFEKLCEVSYSCVQNCKRDYSSNCPIGWKETLIHCLAPSSYNYNCSKVIQKDLTENEKIMLSKKCNIFWPCSNYEVLLKNLIYDNMTEQDYISIMSGPVDPSTGRIVNV